MEVVVGIDIGGTFTDAAAYDFQSEKLYITKVPSTPSDPSIAFIKAINKIADQTGISYDRIQRIVHGTTVGTNAIIERKGSRVGILTTQGFEDILIIGRQKRGNMYDLFVEAETPLFLAPRRRIIGVPERVDSEGSVIKRLDEEKVSEAVDTLVGKFQVDSIAVCYLFSFLNSDHEIRTKEIVREKYPHVRVSLSSAVDPKFREYERLCVTAFDAYIGPIVSEYFGRLSEEMRKIKIPAELQIMQSSGGISGAETVLSKPVTTVLSGPSAGAIGGMFTGKLAGWKNVITFDMGGTSSDVALIQDAKPLLSYEGKVERYPLRVPMIDINTIGAGGGSIAWIDAGGALRVGPQSAGAEPGPACYDMGGSEPTVTDASVVLGYLNPDYFASGEVKLKQDLAWKAIEEKSATPLGLDVPQAALGIHRIVNANMADQLRLVTIKRGFDPRGFALLAMGGGGPVNAAMLAADLHINTVIIPSTPGVLSAFGLLVAQIQHQHAKTYKKHADEIDLNEVNMVFAELDKFCQNKMLKEKAPIEELQVNHYAEMRYVGQAYELEIQLSKDLFEEQALKEAITDFHVLHDQIYGHKDEMSPVEFVNLRAVHSYQMPEPDLHWESQKNSLNDASKGSRKAYFAGSDKPVNTMLYQRELLPLGVSIPGPAIVEQQDTTTVIYPGQTASVDQWGNLIIDIAEKT